jgi:hypothetical protein
MTDGKFKEIYKGLFFRKIAYTTYDIYLIRRVDGLYYHPYSKYLFYKLLHVYKLLCLFTQSKW